LLIGPLFRPRSASLPEVDPFPPPIIDVMAWLPAIERDPARSHADCKIPVTSVITNNRRYGLSLFTSKWSMPTGVILPNWTDQREPGLDCARYGIGKAS